MFKGIDVSDNQGVINWTKVKAAGVQFAILRSTISSGEPDKQLANNIKGCLEVGIPFSFYKYMYATTTAKARQEAKRVIEVLQGYGIVPHRSIKIWADVEDEILKPLGTADLTKVVNAFREAVLESGFQFGLYMNNNNYKGGELDTKQFDCDIWIARYPATKSMNFGELPDDKYKPVVNAGVLWGWQFSSTGKVDGINGNVDLDVCYGDIGEEALPRYYPIPQFTLVDSLNNIGVDSSYEYRKKIAVANNISDYSGTAEQNLKMLALLNSGKLIAV